MNKEICILEDDDNIRELIQMVLEIRGFNVQAFSNIRKFREKEETVTPDLFLLDYMLPDGNGLEICQELKRKERTRNIPVIIMSAHPDIFGLKGADDLLAKPFDVDELINRISKQL